MAKPTSSSTAAPSLDFVQVNPQGADALALLREAAIEARELYPDSFPPGTPWPVNSPTPERGIYLVGYSDGKPVACGALRPIDADCVEVRRMFVTADSRRKGLARAMLQELESRAADFGYSVMQLETGNRQLSAITLYESLGFKPIAPFGEYANDPLSVCFEKIV
ncbi:MAG: GNAT family N-acetyltransferase [Xanthomonadales bacterium]|nr:GNAT family N-acetyltransferase [Xanthomonadales bacterium]